MLAIAPEMVRSDKVESADDPDRTTQLVFAHPVNRTSINGVTGQPTQSTKVKGQELFSWMCDDLVDLIQRGMHENPPLNFSYFSRS